MIHARINIARTGYYKYVYAQSGLVGDTGLEPATSTMSR